MLHVGFCHVSAGHIVNAHSKLYIFTDSGRELSAHFTKDFCCLWFCLSMLYSWCFWQRKLLPPIGHTFEKLYSRFTLQRLLGLPRWRPKVRVASADQAAVGVKTSLAFPEGISSRFAPPPFPVKHLQQWLRSQRTNHLNIWMLLHTEHFLLCLQPVVPHLVLRAPSLSVCSPVQPGPNSTVLIHNHDAGFSLSLSKTLTRKVQISSPGYAACNHYSGLIILYGSPPKSATEICYKR